MLLFHKFAEIKWSTAILGPNIAIFFFVCVFLTFEVETVRNVKTQVFLNVFTGLKKCISKLKQFIIFEGTSPYV